MNSGNVGSDSNNRSKQSAVCLSCYASVMELYETETLGPRECHCMSRDQRFFGLECCRSVPSSLQIVSICADLFILVFFFLL